MRSNNEPNAHYTWYNANLLDFLAIADNTPAPSFLLKKVQQRPRTSRIGKKKQVPKLLEKV